MLKCFRLVDSASQHPQTKGAGHNALEVVETDLLKGKYIAVSYRWEPPPGEDNAKRTFYIKSLNRSLKLRKVLLNRIVCYVKYVTKQEQQVEDVPFWIDKWSINQRDRREKNVSVQSMDLVYKNCKAAVGCLWVQIRTQEELETLGNLLKGQIADESQHGPALGTNVDLQTAKEVLKLLLHITDDPWWQSAWIFQEDYISGVRMWLLIRYTSTLYRMNTKKQLGDLREELVVNSADFRKYATLFCLAYRKRMAGNRGVQEACNRVLERAGKYNITHKYDQGATGCKIRKAMSSTVFYDLSRRMIQHTSDLPAVSANCLDYPIRLNPTRIKRSRNSLNVCILALYLINGELINNAADRPGKLGQTIFQFLQNQAMSLEPPVEGGELTFMKHCRLSEVKLLNAGISARGMLWKVCKELPPNQLLPACSSVHEECGPVEYRRSRLQDLARLLRHLHYKRLAKDVEYLLENDQLLYSNGKKWPSSFIMNMMADKIVKAMDAGKPLQLGLPVPNHPKAYRSYRAIFVRDYHESQDQRKSFLFTSWSCTQEDTREGLLTRLPAKYVSLEVKSDGRTIDGHKILRTQRWVNGLCFSNGERTRDFLFPWPRSLME